MKGLLLLISFSILCLFSFTQTNVQQDLRINQILKTALASKGGYFIYGRSGTAGFINIAVLNQSSRTLCWFTCHGRLFDSTNLTNQEFHEVTSKQLDPFVLYQNICDKYLADIAAAKDIYRVYGDIQLLDKLNGNYRALFAMETVQAAKTRLQKLIAIENVRKKILIQLAYLNCKSPFGLHNDPLYSLSKEQAGTMIQTKDSTLYYNIDPTSAVSKISLYKRSAGQLYIQNRFSEIIDSVALQPEKYDLLQKEKTDVFLLYRGWLEMQWQGALAAIKRQSTGLYSQVNAQNEKEIKELYNQLNAIGAKINQLNWPEVKSIEQAVYDTYKSETSEIAYMPLLGIAYSLTQTRGMKEYELTNHLGNVLATVSDKKNGVPSSSNSSLIDHYEPDIVSAQDYYPFGMLQPGRSYLSPNGDKYRYGFNGKENDNEVKGEGNQQDYGMRIYDPRIGKFLSIDPITKDYPELTPYQFASNKPINSIDLDGLEGWELNTVANRLRNEGKHLIIFNPVDNLIRRDFYNPHILTANMYGGVEIGRKYDVEKQVAAVKQQHDEVVGEEIASGLGGAIGYLLGGEKGAAIGSVGDQLLLSIDGLPGKSGYSTKPEGQKWAEWVPNTEQPVAKTTDPTNLIRTERPTGNKSSRDVGDLIGKIKRNIKLDPVEVASINNKLYIINGHHRTEAAIRTQTKVQYRILTKAEWQKYGWNNEQEIINAAAEANIQKVKLDNRVIQKASKTTTVQ